MANLVAIATLSRLARTKGPTNSSLRPKPYMSAVSNRVTPVSSAASRVASASSESVGP